jgi:hypothetical protein
LQVIWLGIYVRAVTHWFVPQQCELPNGNKHIVGMYLMLALFGLQAVLTIVSVVVSLFGALSS